MLRVWVGVRQPEAGLPERSLPSERPSELPARSHAPSGRVLNCASREGSSQLLLTDDACLFAANLLFKAVNLAGRVPERRMPSARRSPGSELLQSSDVRSAHHAYTLLFKLERIFSGRPELVDNLSLGSQLGLNSLCSVLHNSCLLSDLSEGCPTCQRWERRQLRKFISLDRRCQSPWCPIPERP